MFGLNKIWFYIAGVLAIFGFVSTASVWLRQDARNDLLDDLNLQHLESRIENIDNAEEVLDGIENMDDSAARTALCQRLQLDPAICLEGTPVQ